MGEIGPRLERILIVLTVGVLAIVSILVYRMPGIMCCMNHVYILLCGLVLTIILLMLISQAMDFVHFLMKESNREKERAARKEDIENEYEKEKKYIELNSLAKQKDIENKKQLMAVEFENYKQKELFKKGNGLD